LKQNRKIDKKLQKILKNNNVFIKNSKISKTAEWKKNLKVDKIKKKKKKSEQFHDFWKTATAKNMTIASKGKIKKWENFQKQLKIRKISKFLENLNTYQFWIPIWIHTNLYLVKQQVASNVYNSKISKLSKKWKFSRFLTSLKNCLKT